MSIVGMTTPDPSARGRWTRRAFLGAGVGALGGAAITYDAFVLEAHAVLVSRHEVRVPGLPEALDGVTLVHFTDTHLPANATAARNAHDAARAIAPDLVLFTGDIVEYPRGLPAARELMEGTRGRFGTFALLGNWEHSSGVTAELAEQAYGRAGCELLVNRRQSVRIRDHDVEIRMFDDFVKGAPNLQLAEVPSTAPLRIWATHAPGLVAELPAAPTPPALMLAGHTHGGQIRLPLLPPVLPIGSGGCTAGWYAPGGLPLYVSRGVGTTDIRARFRCPAELPVFTFRRA
jgi:predicted MPP superfamily phosphohydrolase